MRWLNCMLVVATGCGGASSIDISKQKSAVASDDSVTIRATPPVDLTKPVPAPKIRAPRPHPLTLVSAILEGDVASVRSEYDDTKGPRTVATFGNVRAHAGSVPDQVEVSQQMGPMPNGQTLFSPDLPQFTAGNHYIIFLTNEPWRQTPIVAKLAFRVETIGGKPVVLEPDGRAVKSIGVEGVKFAGASLLNPASTHGAPTTVRTDIAATDLANAIAADQFVVNALQAASAVGASFSTPRLQPDTTLPWHTSITTHETP